MGQPVRASLTLLAIGTVTLGGISWFLVHDRDSSFRSISTVSSPGARHRAGVESSSPSSQIKVSQTLTSSSQRIEKPTGLHVRVTDRRATPIEGAELLLRDRRRGKWSRLSNGEKSSTDSEGWWRHPNPEPGEHQIAVRKLGYVPTQQSVSYRPPHRSVTVVLVKGAVLTGVVVNSEGEAVFEASIEIDGTSMKTQANAEGRFQLSHVPTSTGITLRVESVGYQPCTKRVNDLVEGATRHLGTLILERGFAIAGQVVDEDGIGVTGAEVRAVPFRPEIYHASDRYRSHPVTADKAGRFLVTGLYQARYRVVVRADGALSLPTSEGAPDSSSEAVEASRPPAFCTIVVKRGTLYEGRVVHPNGEAVAGARISVSSENAVNRATTSITGRFLFPSVPHGELTVRAGRGFVVGEAVTVSGVEHLPREVVLPRGAELEADLFVDKNRSFPTHLTLTLEATGGGSGESVVAHGRVNEDHVLFTDLPAGLYRAHFRGEALIGRVAGSVELHAGRRAAFSVFLEEEPFLIVTIEVRDKQGIPVEGAMVTVNREGPHYSYTDHQGRTEVTLRGPGAHLDVYANRYGRYGDRSRGPSSKRAPGA